MKPRRIYPRCETCGRHLDDGAPRWCSDACAARAHQPIPAPAPDTPPAVSPLLSPTDPVSDLGTTVRDLYAYLDKHATEAAALAAVSGHPVTCSACTSAACCKQLTTTSMPEIFVLAEALLRRSDWRDALPRLRDAVLADCAVSPHTAPPHAAPPHATPLTRRSRFLADVPCGLLDPTTKRCTVYDVRPACCRFHIIVSDPKACDAPRGPDGKPDPSIPAPGTQALNLLELEAAVWELSAAIARDVGDSPYLQAPISLGVLHAVWGLVNSSAPGAVPVPGSVSASAEDRALVQRHVEGLPSIETWLETHWRALAAEERADTSEGSRAAAEQLYTIGHRVFGRDQ